MKAGRLKAPLGFFEKFFMGHGKGKSCSWIETEGEPTLFSGMIALWFSSVASIPTGWILCDGNNGTPKLANRFVPGAGDTYSPDDKGGQLQHNHTISSQAPYLLSGSIVSAIPAVDFKRALDNHNHGGLTSNTDGRPRYHALAYIMRL